MRAMIDPDVISGKFVHGRPKPDLKPGDHVTTNFHERQSARIRVVESVEPAPGQSQTGWYVRTRCGLYCDSAWFRKAVLGDDD